MIKDIIAIDVSYNYHNNYISMRFSLIPIIWPHPNTRDLSGQDMTYGGQKTNLYELPRNGNRIEKDLRLLEMIDEDEMAIPGEKWMAIVWAPRELMALNKLKKKIITIVIKSLFVASSIRNNTTGEMVG